MCVVEVKGRENLVPSCSFPIEGPMEIMTHSPRVLRARKTNVELLLSNHPDDCLYCERNGSCELQHPPVDTGLRFRVASANTFQCPSCATAVTVNNQDHGEAE